MKLETKRLILRPWKLEDAEYLYMYAKEPEVGPSAGWPPHQSVEESREIIEKILSAEYTFALVCKETNHPIGSMGLSMKSDLVEKDGEAEVGYWIGVPFWGQGLVTEALEEVLRYAFEDLMLDKVWVSCFVENHGSKRVQEKCGFTLQYKCRDKYLPLLDVTRESYISSIGKEEWVQRRKKK
ncbi:MAG: GNAT family N-acetyltransferase [Tissierellia bacterium]|nr:GNAT family N-acetyltransferase [Tissierellia bacterium]